MANRNASRALPICAALACLLVSRVAVGQVPGHPNPFGGRWSARLDTLPGGTAPLVVALTLRDTTFNGRFVVDLEAAALMPVLEPDAECAWASAGFFGRFYWDPDRNPILDLVRVLRGGEGEKRCRFELRVLARPNGDLIGWWCQGPWNAGKREGPVLLIRRG